MLASSLKVVTIAVRPVSVTASLVHPHLHPLDPRRLARRLVHVDDRRPRAGCRVLAVSNERGVWDRNFSMIRSFEKPMMPS